MDEETSVCAETSSFGDPDRFDVLCDELEVLLATLTFRLLGLPVKFPSTERVVFKDVFPVCMPLVSPDLTISSETFATCSVVSFKTLLSCVLFLGSIPFVSITLFSGELGVLGSFSEPLVFELVFGVVVAELTPTDGVVTLELESELKLLAALKFATDTGNDSCVRKFW